MAETQRIYVVVERKSLLSRSENGRNTLDMYQECEMLYRATAAFVSSAWQWLGLWLGSCLRPQSPAKDEIAA